MIRNNCVKEIFSFAANSIIAIYINYYNQTEQKIVTRKEAVNSSFLHNMEYQ